MKRNLFSLIFIAAMAFATILPVKADYQENYPYVLVQPNGDTLRCFVTGDEFRRRVHDSLGYTIIPDTETGMYVYATMRDGKPVPTSYIPGRDDPRTLNLMPRVWQEFRQDEMLLQGTARELGSANQGQINYLVITIAFADKAVTAKQADVIPLFNLNMAGASSAHAYFKHTSYGNVKLDHYFYPDPGTATVLASVTVAHQRCYYEPYNAKTNPTGYQPADRRSREDSLLREAISKVTVDPMLKLDSDGDGCVDNITFILAGDRGAWADLLWPHRTAMTSGPLINKCRVNDYVVVLEKSIRVGTIVHETIHAMGAPDLYRYNTTPASEPMGQWDIMSSSSELRQTSAQLKERYLKWQKIPVLDRYGVYVLNPLDALSSDNTAYRIDAKGDESFLLEYRVKGGAYETNIPGSGLLVTRINKQFSGNAKYDPSAGKYDEVYLLRPASGIANAPFGGKGRDILSSTTDPKPTLTNGSVHTSLRLERIAASGGKLSFYYGPKFDKHLHVNFSMEDLGGGVVQFRDNSSSDGTIITRRWTFEGGIPKSISGVREVKVYFRKTGNHDVQLKAKNQHGTSDNLKRTVVVK